MSNVLSTVVVTFASGADATVSVESDPVNNVQDSGTTQLTVYDYIVAYTNGSISLKEYLSHIQGTATTTEEKSIFTQDDEYYFLVHFSSGMGNLSLSSSAGDITYLGTTIQDREQTLDFIELDSVDNKPSLSYKPNGPLDETWYGNKGTGLTTNNSDLL